MLRIVKSHIKFSIIIPLYNKETCIEETLRSVQGQSYSNWEALVVDDGSTDNGLLIVESVKDGRIKIYQKSNGGVSSARNYGIEKAEGRFIVFLDADDIWQPDFLETLSVLIKDYPDAGMFATSYQYLNGGNIENPKIRFVPEYGKSGLLADYCKSAALGLPPVWTGATCVKKEVFDQVGLFPLGVKRGEDIDMWLRVACKYEIAYMNKPKSFYKIDVPDSAVKKKGGLGDSFPYYKWLFYKYNNKISLMIYSFKKIYHCLKRVIC